MTMNRSKHNELDMPMPTSSNDEQRAKTHTYCPGCALCPVYTPLFCFAHFRGVCRVKLLSHVFLASSKLWGINGNEKTFDPPRLCMLDNPLRNGPVFVHVQLEEETLTRFCSIDNLVE